MVVVESPLQCDLPELNTSSSTSTDTNLSSNPSHSSSTSSSSPGTSTSNASNNVRSDTSVTGDSDNNNASSSSPVDTGGDSSSSKTSTTVSAPAGGMQESTYVLSDSAYIPAKPTATNNTVSNTILPTFSEDSADYRNNSTSNNSPTSNSYQENNNNNNNNNDSSPPVSSIARSAVVRVECAVWSKYITAATGKVSDTFTTTSKAVPLQDYHYAMANKSSTTYCADQNAAAIGDLQTVMINCIKVCLLFYYCFGMLDWNFIETGRQLTTFGLYHNLMHNLFLFWHRSFWPSRQQCIVPSNLPVPLLLTKLIQPPSLAAAPPTIH